MSAYAPPSAAESDGARAAQNQKCQGKTVKKQWHGAASCAAGLVIALAAGTASRAPINFNQTWYAQHGPEDDFAARAGWDAGNQAAPQAFVAATQKLTAARAFESISSLGFDSERSWTNIGPTVGNVPGPVTYTGAPSVVSGR